jgi:NhaP-type Na+/H+ or K+/H+ antiporter
MRQSWRVLASIFKGARIIFVAGTLGCLALDILLGVFESPPQRFRYVSVIVDNILLTIAFCLIGAVLGFLLSRITRGRKDPQ